MSSIEAEALCCLPFFKYNSNDGRFHHIDVLRAENLSKFIHHASTVLPGACLSFILQNLQRIWDCMSTLCANLSYGPCSSLRIPVSSTFQSLTIQLGLIEHIAIGISWANIKPLLIAVPEVTVRSRSDSGVYCKHARQNDL